MCQVAKPFQKYAYHADIQLILLFHEAHDSFRVHWLVLLLEEFNEDCTEGFEAVLVAEELVEGEGVGDLVHEGDEGVLALVEECESDVPNLKYLLDNNLNAIDPTLLLIPLQKNNGFPPTYPVHKLVLILFHKGNLFPHNYYFLLNKNLMRKD